MKILLGSNVMSDTILRPWLNKLPLNTNQILAPTIVETDIDKLSEVVDCCLP